MIELIVQSGKHQGKRLRLPSEGQVIIGRDEECQIRLASSDVSRHHCSLRISAEGIVARDLDSRNGTYLNEALMEEETLLKPGDVLRIGPIALQLPGPPSHPSRAYSDDDIANWLSSAEQLGGSSDNIEGLPGDTTIIPRTAAFDAVSRPTPAPTPVPAAGPPHSPLTATSMREPARQYRSVAEEAADIIRRHWEIVKAQRDQE